MDNKEKKTCTQCRAQCPVDALQCGKGRKMFEQPAENQAVSEEHGGREDHEGRSSWEERREHGGREGCAGHGSHEGRNSWEERREHGGRGERENRGGHGGYCWNIGREDGKGRDHAKYAEDSLTALLCRCGYIADRKSGRHRGQKRILQILLDSPTISQKELTDKLKIEPGSMSEVLAKLEDKGFIQREKDASDRRRMLITLTARGREEAERCSGSLDEGIMDALSEEEKKSLKELLGKLLSQWQTQRREHGKGRPKGGQD